MIGAPPAAREGLDKPDHRQIPNPQRPDAGARQMARSSVKWRAVFGAGWNVIKVLWARLGITRYSRRTGTMVARRSAATVDGRYQDLGLEGTANHRQ